MTNSPESGNAPIVHLIDHLWPQVREAHMRLADARRQSSATKAEWHLLFRTLTLLMAAEPARSWDDVTPKVLIQALIRNDHASGIALAETHLVDMLEAAIMADHAALNGDEHLED